MLRPLSCLVLGLALIATPAAAGGGEVERLLAEGRACDATLDHACAADRLARARELAAARPRYRGRMPGILRDLARHQRALGNELAAEVLLFESAIQAVHVFGPDSLQYGATLNALAYLHARSGRVRDALSTARRAVAILTPANSPLHRAAFLDTLALALEGMRALDEAEATYAEVERLLARPSPAWSAVVWREVAAAHRHHADFLREHRGQAARADRLLRRAAECEARSRALASRASPAG